MVSTTARAAARAYVRLPVQVRTVAGQWTGKTRDLSLGGTLVFVEPPYPSGACTVVMDLPGGALTVEAEVRFTIPGVGVGLQFTDLPPAAQQRIQQVVEAASATFGLWGMVGKYLGEFDSRVTLQLPSQFSVKKLSYSGNSILLCHARNIQGRLHTECGNTL